MVSVTIQQDMSSIPPMTSPIIDLTSRPESPKVHQQFKVTTTETTTTTLPPLPAQQQSTTEAMMMKCIGELEHIMANLIQENKEMEERLDKHGVRLYTLEQLDIPQQVGKVAMQAPLQNRFRDLPEADMKEILHQRMWETESYKSHEDHIQLFEALEKSMKRYHSEELAQDLAKARKKNKKSHELPKTPPGHRACHIPKVNLRQDWWKPLKEERPATLERGWSIPSSDVLVPKNNWASALASNYSPPPEDSRLALTSDIATFMDWFCKRREYLRYVSKGSRPALSISRMKAAYYPDVGLEQMVPDQFWIDEECKYDIAAMYGISHWWFQRQRFCIDRHIPEDFKYLYPSDFEDLYLLDLQGHLNHLHPKDKKILTMAVKQWTKHLVIRQRVEDFQLGIESYQTQLNLTKPQWDVTGFEYKHDYTAIDSPRAVMFWDKYEDKANDNEMILDYFQSIVNEYNTVENSPGHIKNSHGKMENSPDHIKKSFLNHKKRTNVEQATSGGDLLFLLGFTPLILNQSENEVAKNVAHEGISSPNIIEIIPKNMSPSGSKHEYADYLAPPPKLINGFYILEHGQAKGFGMKGCEKDYRRIITSMGDHNGLNALSIY
uniref:Uncharacterized protein n=1 Tax=Tanacetum cinerariifolium TaxID=118510 RepID=A0A6L2NTU0_TANCI|nr:hypothetical protein [Tanacetum cinerariifolium]